MWFQDLFNYDFRRTEMCIIPYATQQGEISFCAYNTGIGWRNIIEKMHMTATLTKWYEEHGRHEIFAGGKHVDMGSKDHTLVLNAEAVGQGRADGSRRVAHREERARRKAPRAQGSQMSPRSCASTRRWKRSIAAKCSRSSPRCRFRGSATRRKKQDVAEVVHKPTV
jgi:hypothetical protein